MQGEHNMAATFFNRVELLKTIAMTILGAIACKCFVICCLVSTVRAQTL